MWMVARAVMVAAVLAGAGLALGAGNGEVTVKVDQPGVAISPMLYGLMTEEINHSYDGGLYAELVQNRVFADPQGRGNRGAVPHWSVVMAPGVQASMAVDTQEPVNTGALKRSLRLDIQGGGEGRAGVANDGYWGIPVKPNTTYRASFYARSTTGEPLTVGIESNDGKTVYASETVTGVGAGWKKYSVTLKTGEVAGEGTTAARLVISTSGRTKGSVWLSLVSLFPPTYKDRPNGLRPDLMELMKGMKPAFLRFPGGNYLEGNTIAERFDWKKTIGPLEERPGHMCPWGYRSTDGLGLLEFLNWCEDVEMEPVLAVFAGYALRGERVRGPELEPYIQEALEEIEYVTGGPETVWGARRVKDGHAAPFKLQYVEVGNEDFFDREKGSYDERYWRFYDAIKKKYPALQLIATMPVTSRDGKGPDVVDDHYYRTARDMARDAGHYDKTDRKGPKIFVGEWASTEGSPTPTVQAALGDAAWMTGMERNSDVVVMSCYAPLLVNVNPGARQWGTNLIGYDALRSYGSPSYWVQRMIAENRGDRVLPVTVKVERPAVAEVPAPKGCVGVGTWATQAEYKDLEVRAGDKVLYRMDAEGKGVKKMAGEWDVAGGVVRQSSEATACQATFGDTGWTDYTYTLKARKLGGAEGFLVVLHSEGPDDFVWWNIGGWGNTRTALEVAEGGGKREIGESKPVTVEEGKWYDLKAEVKGRMIRGYVDGKLVSEGELKAIPPADPVYSTASKDEKTGEVILKVVNMSDEAYALKVGLQGAKGVGSTATLERLEGTPKMVNTIEEPEKAAVKKSTVPVGGTTFTENFPAHSMSVLRVKPE